MDGAGPFPGAACAVGGGGRGLGPAPVVATALRGASGSRPGSSSCSSNLVVEPRAATLGATLPQVRFDRDLVG